MGVVFLDCSKCYERVPHHSAAAAAYASGCPGETVNLVFSLYAGQRYLQTHGAVSAAAGGNTGLVAGCGFAVHILKAFLHIPPLGYGIRVRVYVDDITVSVVAPSAWGVVPAQLNELSPPGARGTFPGTVYQLGNLIASSNAILQTTIAANSGGNYAISLASVAVCAALAISLTVWLGPEAQNVAMAD